MNKLLIGVTGKANSGKDTVASMINHFYYCGLVDSTPDFKDWNDNKVLYGYNNYCPNNYNHTTHFADTLKNVLSIMYNINLEYFYDRKYKDFSFYDLINNKFISYEEYMQDKSYLEFTIEEINEEVRNLNDFIEIYKHTHKPLIKLRTLLQYFGTEVCRNNLHDNIWTNSCIDSCLKNKFTDYNVIADLRFPAEYDAIKKQNNNLIIKIIRNNNELNFEHESEKYELDADITINNDGTLIDLYEQVKHIYNENILFKLPF